jgi:hypothetical protein
MNCLIKYYPCSYIGELKHNLHLFAIFLSKAKVFNLVHHGNEIARILDGFDDKEILFFTKLLYNTFYSKNSNSRYITYVPLQNCDKIPLFNFTKYIEFKMMKVIKSYSMVKIKDHFRPSLYPFFENYTSIATSTINYKNYTVISSSTLNNNQKSTNSLHEESLSIIINLVKYLTGGICPKPNEFLDGAISVYILIMIDFIMHIESFLDTGIIDHVIILKKILINDMKRGSGTSELYLNYYMELKFEDLKMKLNEYLKNDFFEQKIDLRHFSISKQFTDNYRTCLLSKFYRSPSCDEIYILPNSKLKFCSLSSDCNTYIFENKILKEIYDFFAFKNLAFSNFVDLFGISLKSELIHVFSSSSSQLNLLTLYYQSKLKFPSNIWYNFVKTCGKEENEFNDNVHNYKTNIKVYQHCLQIFISCFILWLSKNGVDIVFSNFIVKNTQKIDRFWRVFTKSTLYDKEISSCNNISVCKIIHTSLIYDSTCSILWKLERLYLFKKEKTKDSTITTKTTLLSDNSNSQIFLRLYELDLSKSTPDYPNTFFDNTNLYMIPEKINMDPYFFDKMVNTIFDWRKMTEDNIPFMSKCIDSFVGGFKERLILNQAHFKNSKLIYNTNESDIISCISKIKTCIKSRLTIIMQFFDAEPSDIIDYSDVMDTDNDYNKNRKVHNKELLDSTSIDRICPLICNSADKYLIYDKLLKSVGMDQNEANTTIGINFLLHQEKSINLAAIVNDILEKEGLIVEDFNISHKKWHFFVI